MKKTEIVGFKRANLGRPEAQRLRAEGNVPCVLYGGGEQVSFYAPAYLFRPLIYTPDAFEVTLNIEGAPLSAEANGNGPVDAIFKAIREIMPHSDAHLQLYQVHAVTGGTDAQAEVTVRLEENGKTVNGQGADSDTLVASARAYIHALNKLLVKRESLNPQTASA